MDWDFTAKGAGGLSAIGAGIYGIFRLLKRDSRDDANIGAQDSAMHQVIATLREEITRLSDRLEKVESQNTQCREENAAMALQITALQRQVGCVI